MKSNAEGIDETTVNPPVQEEYKVITTPTELEKNADSCNLQNVNDMKSNAEGIDETTENPPVQEDNTQSSGSINSVHLVVMATICLLIIVAIFTLYIKDLNEEEEVKSTKASQSDPEIESNSQPVVVCKTSDCIKAADMLIKNMNLTADPCVDFNEYACGRFIKEAPEGPPSVSPSTMLSGKNTEILKSIVEEPISPSEPKYLGNLKRLFKSCTDEDKIEQRGVKDFLDEVDFIESWPTLNPNWTEIDPSVLIASYEMVFVEPVFRYGLTADMDDSNKVALELSEPQLGMSPEFLLLPRDVPPIMAYQQMLADTAVALGAAKPVADQDAKDIVDLEIELAKIMVPKEQRRDARAQYNPVTLKKLSQMYPEIDIPRAIRAAFSIGNVDLADDQIVINKFPTYIGNLSRIIKSTSNRTLQNLFGMKYAQTRVAGLTRRLREIESEFQKVLSGSPFVRPRWEECLQGVTIVFWKGMAKQYIARTFSETSKTSVLKMVDNIMKEFEKVITENSWMGQSTKDEALTKLAAYRKKIGYPDVGFGESEIEDFYKDHVMQEDNFYANRLLGKRLSDLQGIKSFGKPVNKDEWYMHPFLANAQYIPSTNEINFPAGILQPPYFSEKYFDYINYGGAGALIGHEITHGFDDQGSQYDSKGNLRDWWDPGDKATFAQKTKCIVDQFNNFLVPHIGKNVSGINTKGEAVADSDGLRVAFRALKTLPATSESLPGLNLTQDQIFFLAFAQTYCEKISPQYLAFIVASDNHPPSQFRIVGSLQNSEDFSKAYNCPKGSVMNPEKKCMVW